MCPALKLINPYSSEIDRYCAYPSSTAITREKRTNLSLFSEATLAIL